MQELLAKLKQLEDERAEIESKITAIQKVIELFNVTPVKTYLTAKKEKVVESSKPAKQKGTIEDAIEYATDIIREHDDRSSIQPGPRININTWTNLL